MIVCGEENWQLTSVPLPSHKPHWALTWAQGKVCHLPSLESISSLTGDSIFGNLLSVHVVSSAGASLCILSHPDHHQPQLQGGSWYNLSPWPQWHAWDSKKSDLWFCGTTERRTFSPLHRGCSCENVSSRLLGADKEANRNRSRAESDRAWVLSSRY